MTPKQTAALEYFSNGYNCAQSVLAAFCEDCGFDTDAALRLASGFGGGMRCGEMCGAVTGGIMVVGLKCGFFIKGNFGQKGYCNQKTFEFIEKFREQNSSALCRDLLGSDIRSPEDLGRPEMQGLFKAVCPKMIENAVGILESMEF